MSAATGGLGSKADLSAPPLPEDDGNIVETIHVIDPSGIDPSLYELRRYVEAAFDVKEDRKRMILRGLPEVAEELLRLEEQLTRQTTKRLRKTPIGPWLVEHKTAGLHIARVVALIGNPRRFPGQRCSEGHHHLPDYEPGSPCLVADDEGARCLGTMLPPRTTTGVRSLWHWAGLVPDPRDGRLIRRRKGEQASFTPKVKTSCLMPDAGIAAQIVRNREHPYREVYDAAKERIARERGVVVVDPATERTTGDAERMTASDTRRGVVVGTEAVTPSVIEDHLGLRPFQIEQRARIIAVKALLGDMLMEWKRLVDRTVEGVSAVGEPLPLRRAYPIKEKRE